MWIFLYKEKVEATVKLKKFAKLMLIHYMVNIEWKIYIIILNISPTEADKILKI